MDKPFIKKILAVVLGISLIILIFETASLIYSAVTLGDLKEINDYLNDIQSYMRWSALGLALMMVPALTCYVFAFFSEKKFYKITAASLSLIVVICCIVFISMCRRYAVDKGLSDYASAAGYFSELMQIMVASALIGVYFLLISVLPAKKVKPVEEAEVTEAITEEVRNEEN